MKALTKEGQQYVQDIAAKYNLKNETVEELLKAVVNGKGNMAQFNLPELGGSGQWMRGGMTQVGDMFNQTLRTTVDKICNELADLASTKVLFENTETHYTEDGIASHENIRESNPRTQNSYSVTADSSWPSVFGSPTASGSQNNVRYAYFAPARRLVIDENGKRTIYDTKHHNITGISQQQGGSTGHKFTSQDGAVDLSSLAVVSDPGEPSQPTPEIAYDVTSTGDLRSAENSKSPQDVIIQTIEKINVLFEKGQITEEEFKSKKQELLARL